MSENKFGRRLTPGDLLKLRQGGLAAVSEEVRELVRRRREHLESLGVKPPAHWVDERQKEAQP